MLRSDTSRLASLTGDDPQRPGAVQVYAKAPEIPDCDWEFKAYLMGEDAMGIDCSGSGTGGYSGNAGLYEKWWPGLEEPIAEQPPPPYPPEGMTQDEYDQLNDYEKRVVWKYWYYIPQMISARNNAEAWAALQTAEGEHNGRRAVHFQAVALRRRIRRATISKCRELVVV